MRGRFSQKAQNVCQRRLAALDGPDRTELTLESATRQICQGATGELDLGHLLSAEAHLDWTLSGCSLSSSPFCCRAASPAALETIRVQDLKSQRLLCPHEQRLSRGDERSFRSWPQSLFRLEISSLETIKHAVQQGLGLACSPAKPSPGSRTYHHPPAHRR